MKLLGHNLNNIQIFELYQKKKTNNLKKNKILEMA
jgi:hypothetical protein